MADEDKTIAQEAAPAEDAPQVGGGGMKKYLIMAGIILTTAAIGYVVTLKFVKPMVAGESAEAALESGDNADAAAEAAEKARKRKARERAAAEGATESHIFEVEDVIVNPAGTGGTRFLSVSVGFEVEFKETMGLFESRQPQIRDALITILGSKNIEQLTDMKQKEIARLQIKKRVETLLDTDELLAIYFTDFVIQ